MKTVSDVQLRGALGAGDVSSTIQARDQRRARASRRAVNADEHGQRDGEDRRDRAVVVAVRCGRRRRARSSPRGRRRARARRRCSASCSRGCTCRPSETFADRPPRARRRVAARSAREANVPAATDGTRAGEAGAPGARAVAGAVDRRAHVAGAGAARRSWRSGGRDASDGSDSPTTARGTRGRRWSSATANAAEHGGPHGDAHGRPERERCRWREVSVIVIGNVPEVARFDGERDRVVPGLERDDLVGARRGTSVSRLSRCTRTLTCRAGFRRVHELSGMSPRAGRQRDAFRVGRYRVRERVDARVDAVEHGVRAIGGDARRQHDEQGVLARHDDRILGADDVAEAVELGDGVRCTRRRSAGVAAAATGCEPALDVDARATARSRPPRRNRRAWPAAPAGCSRSPSMTRGHRRQVGRPVAAAGATTQAAGDRRGLVRDLGERGDAPVRPSARAGRAVVSMSSMNGAVAAPPDSPLAVSSTKVCAGVNGCVDGNERSVAHCDLIDVHGAAAGRRPHRSTGSRNAAAGVRRAHDRGRCAAPGRRSPTAPGGCRRDRRLRAPLRRSARTSPATARWSRARPRHAPAPAPAAS